ncbi:MAG: hypothetical protein ACHP7H_00310 [Hyphomicrobiales bacterium]
MAAPASLRPQLELIQPRLRGVIATVAAARLAYQTDEPDSSLTVGGAIAAVELATENWFEAADDLEAAIDESIDALLVEFAGQDDVAQFDAQSEFRASQSALMLLHVAVMNEIALLQPLEGEKEDLLVREVEGWPNDERAELESIALGDRGLVYLLFAGTDDDDGDNPAGEDGDAPAGAGGAPADDTTEIVPELEGT